MLRGNSQVLQIDSLLILPAFRVSLDGVLLVYEELQVACMSLGFQLILDHNAHHRKLHHSHEDDHHQCEHVAPVHAAILDLGLAQPEAEVEIRKEEGGEEACHHR